MSLASQARALHAQASVFRQDLFGTNATGTKVQFDYNRGEHTFEGYYVLRKNSRQVGEANFVQVREGIIRAPKTSLSFVPETDKQIAFTDETGEKIVLQINEVRGQHPLSAEWALACSGDI